MSIWEHSDYCKWWVYARWMPGGTHGHTCQRENCPRLNKKSIKRWKKARRTLHETSDGANYIANRWVDADECGVFGLVAESWRTSNKTRQNKIRGRMTGNRGNFHSWIWRRGANQTAHSFNLKLHKCISGVSFLPVRIANENLTRQHNNKCLTYQVYVSHSASAGVVKLIHGSR